MGQSVPPIQPGPWPLLDVPEPDSFPESAQTETTAAETHPSAGEGNEEATPPIPEEEWKVSGELRMKCHKQFTDLKPMSGKLQGDQARSFFIQSRLPNTDLSAIWYATDCVVSKSTVLYDFFPIFHLCFTWTFPTHSAHAFLNYVRIHVGVLPIVSW